MDLAGIMEIAAGWEAMETGAAWLWEMCGERMTAQARMTAQIREAAAVRITAAQMAARRAISRPLDFHSGACRLAKTARDAGLRTVRGRSAARRKPIT